ncbi:hypothetical protein ACXYRO_02450 [Mycoplasma sp. 4013]
MKQIMWAKFTNLIKSQFKSKRFYYILLAYFLIFWLIFAISAGINHKKDVNWIINAFTASALITLAFVLLILVFKWGFMERTFERFRENKSISSRYKEEKKMLRMTHAEKVVYLEQKKQKQQPKIKKSNFPFYFNLIIYFIASLIVVIIAYV